MQISLTTVLLLAASAVALPSPQATEESSPQTTEVSQSDPLDALQDLTNQAISALQEQEDGQDVSKRSNQCSIFSAFVRKDWKFLSKKERTDYINAVLCLQQKPSKADPSFAPGARSRYDDFVAVHIDQTLSIHGTGNFLTWHRYYTWAYENALRTECGYKGAQPYWNWFDGSNFANSPLWDGSATSMSGDGSFVQHNGSLSGTGNIYIPSGNGGGCVTSGPFKDMVVNLGPVSPGMDGLPIGVGGGKGHNPRCLRRDLSAYSVDTWMTARNLLNITIGSASHTITSFQNELQGRFADGFLGMHAAGHFTMGGDASDLFSSPTDPIFFLHHAMVDRIYWLWQALHPVEASKIAGTITILNRPPSRDALKSDPINLGVNAPQQTIGDLLNTLSDPFCYIYL